MSNYTRSDNCEYHDGYRAFGRGDRETDCPFKSSADRSIDSRYNRWQMGFNDAVASAHFGLVADQY
jgi:hypothetical protein